MQSKEESTESFMSAVSSAPQRKPTTTFVDEIYARIRKRLHSFPVTIAEFKAAYFAALDEYDSDNRLCHVCKRPTLLACSDCQINFAATVHVCTSPACRDEHERKCYGSKA